MFTELILILLLFLLIALVSFAVFFTFSFFTGAPFVVTPAPVVTEMMSLASVGKKDIVMDLGSGEGRILIAAAKKGATAYGWEINPYLVLWTKFAVILNGVGKKVTVVCQTYQKADLRKATVIIFYNIPGHLSAIEKKIQNELKPGTTIVSYQFPLKNYKPIKQTKSGIFFYKKP